MSIDFEVIKKAADEGDYNSLLSDAIITIVVIFLMVIAAFLSIPFFILTCCCIKNKGKSGKTKCYFFITFGLLVCFIAIFAALIVFIAKLDQSYNEVNCVIAKLPNDLLNGVQGEIQFIGLFGLQNMIKNLQGEINNLSSLSSSFDNIISSNLNESANSAIQSIDSFYSSFKNSETIDAEGVDDIPIPVEELTEKVNDGVKLEFESYGQVASSLSTAAVEGKKYSDPSKVTSTTSTLDSVVVSLDELIAPLDDSLGIMNENMESISGFLPMAYWFVLGVGIFFSLSYFFMVTVLYKQACSGSCYKMSMLIRIFLIALSFLTFILAMISLLLMISSTFISSFCDFSQKILDQTDFGDFLAKFSIEISGKELAFFNECLPAEASGDLMNILDVPSFGDV